MEVTKEWDRSLCSWTDVCVVTNLQKTLGFYCRSAIRVSTKHRLKKMASVKFSILSNGSYVIDALGTMCHVPSTYQLIKMSWGINYHSQGEGRRRLLLIVKIPSVAAHCHTHSWSLENTNWRWKMPFLFLCWQQQWLRWGNTSKIP